MQTTQAFVAARLLENHRAFPGLFEHECEFAPHLAQQRQALPQPIFLKRTHSLLKKGTQPKRNMIIGWCDFNWGC